jgi:hypothetical protein
MLQGARDIHSVSHIGQREESVFGVSARFCAPFNISRLPAASVPCGSSPESMPIGLQIIGKPFDEATVLKVADAFERSTEWHLKYPRSPDDALHPQICFWCLAFPPLFVRRSALQLLGLCFMWHLPRRYLHFLFAAMQSALTSAIAAAIASFNLIWVGGFLRHWLEAWAIAWIVMLPVVLVAAPAILRLSEFITRPEGAHVGDRSRHVLSTVRASKRRHQLDGRPTESSRDRV